MDPVIQDAQEYENAPQKNPKWRKKKGGKEKKEKTRLQTIQTISTIFSSPSFPIVQ